MENRKIKNTSTNENVLVFNGIRFKSLLEVMIYKTLLHEGFEPLYEWVKFVIWEGFKPTVPFYYAKKGSLNDKNARIAAKKKLLDITYTPDFILYYNDLTVIIEAKGFENDIFPMKKKMFRKYLETFEEKVIYFEIKTKKQLLEAIEIIRNYEENERKNQRVSDSVQGQGL